MSSFRILRKEVDPITFIERWGGQILPRMEEELDIDQAIASSMCYMPPVSHRRAVLRSPRPQEVASSSSPAAAERFKVPSTIDVENNSDGISNGDSSMELEKPKQPMRFRPKVPVPVGQSTSGIDNELQRRLQQRKQQEDGELGEVQHQQLDVSSNSGSPNSGNSKKPLSPTSASKHFEKSSLSSRSSSSSSSGSSSSGSSYSSSTKRGENLPPPPPPPPATTGTATPMSTISPEIAKSKLDILKQKVRLVMFAHRMFGGKDYNQLFEGEKRADFESLHKSKILKEESLAQIQTYGIVGIAKEEWKDFDHRPTKLKWIEDEKLELIHEIEALNKRETSWGDLYDDLWYDEDTLADMKYEAFVEQCNMAENGGGEYGTYGSSSDDSSDNE